MLAEWNRCSGRPRRCFRRAQEERPGAVLLELPEDIAEEETSEPVVAPHPRQYAVAGDAAIGGGQEARMKRADGDGREAASLNGDFSVSAIDLSQINMHFNSRRGDAKAAQFTC